MQGTRRSQLTASVKRRFCMPNSRSDVDWSPRCSLEKPGGAFLEKLRLWIGGVEDERVGGANLVWNKGERALLNEGIRSSSPPSNAAFKTDLSWEDLSSRSSEPSPAPRICSSKSGESCSSWGSVVVCDKGDLSNWLVECPVLRY